MALPSTGQITAAMINVELGRSPTDPFNINGVAERTLAGKPSGAISFADFRGKSSEIVVTIPADRGNFILDSLFSAADWTSETKKRVVIPSGVELGPGTANWVIATTTTANGQAGSFGGELILENNGIISGKGGAANGGVGGNALYPNLPGKNGQKLIVINNGTIRAGGGGGGKGGTGGAGGGGSTSSTTRQPTSGDQATFPTTSWYSVDYGSNQLRWSNTSIGANFTTAVMDYNKMTSGALIATIGAYTYYVGTKRDLFEGNPFMASCSIYRTTTTTTNTNGGTGGAGGNGGRGQGFGQTLAAGSAGTAGANGGTNAGKGGTGGTGGAGGGWGANGSAGNTGATGANGNRTNGAAGTAGAAAGLAGFYCTNNANVVWEKTGTRQGRAG